MESFPSHAPEKSKPEALPSRFSKELRRDHQKFEKLTEVSRTRIDNFKDLLEELKAVPKNITKALTLALAVAGPIEAVAGETNTEGYQTPQYYWSYSEDVSTSNPYEPIVGMTSSIYNAATHSEFVENLQENVESYTDSEKVAALGRLGDQLGRNYSYDMFQSNEHVAITQNEIFLGIRGTEGNVGICGNIHKYLVDVATEMGLKAGIISDVQADQSEGAGLHIFAMVEIINDAGDKEIIVVNYGTIIQTGEDTIAGALAAYQRTSGVLGTDGSGKVPMFDGFIQTADGEVSSVGSVASRTLQDIAGMESSREQLENLAEADASGVEVAVDISKGTENITLNSPIYLSYGRYENPGDASNPIKEANSISAGFRINKEASNGGIFSASAIGNFTQVNLHGPDANNEATNYFAAELTAAYQAPRNELMTSDEFAKVSGQFSILARVAGSFMISGENIPFENRALSGDADIAAQYKIVFEQGNTNEFYITTGIQGNFEPNNLEDQEVTLGAETYFKIGVTTALAYDTTLQADASYSTDGIQSEMDLNASIVNGNISFSIGYEKNTDAWGGIEENIIAGLTRTDALGGVASLTGYTGNNGVAGINIQYGLNF